MRKILAWLYVSVDGVVEAPEKWAHPYLDDELGQAAQAGMEAADAMLLGRRTYEEFAAYWPHKTAEDDPFADYLNNTPKYVVSNTLESLEWRNSTLVSGDLVKEITELKEQPGKNIGIVGSATLVLSLLCEGLLDQLDLLLFPLVVGTGKRLFEEGTERLPLKLASSRTFGNGVVGLTYTREGV